MCIRDSGRRAGLGEQGARASGERRFDPDRRRLGGPREHGADRRPPRARGGRERGARRRHGAPVRLPRARAAPAAARRLGLRAALRDDPAAGAGARGGPAVRRGVRDDRALDPVARAGAALRGGARRMTTTAGARLVRAPRGTAMSCKGWAQEAALRMLMNNLDPDVAERPDDLVVYGGTGRAARSWEAFDRIVASLRSLANDETLLVQSGKPVGIFRTHPGAPRVLIANSNLVGKWATWEEFRRLEALGLTMFGQMTAGSWIYIGTQGILQGTYQTFAAAGERHFGSSDLAGRTILTAGLGGMGGAQPLAATLAGAAILCIEVDPTRIERRLQTRYLDEVADSLDDALARVRAAAGKGRALSVGLLGNAAEVVPELTRRGERFDLVTDQTAAHDPLNGYVPVGLDVVEAAALRERDPDAYLRRARESIARHVEALLEYVGACLLY